MKKNHIFAFLSFIIITSSCKTDPQLNMSNNYFSFSDKVVTKSLIISNEGGKELEWNVDNQISWLSINPENGIIESQGEKVLTLSASKYNEPGFYNSTFLISTNGGDKNITVEMELDFTPKIFVGIGIDGFNLNETYESVKIKYGEPEDFIHNFVPEINQTEHVAIYHSKGIGFFFYNTSQTIIADNEETYAIGLTSPYNGVTKMNIGIETPFVNVKKCYGEPDEIFDDDYIIYSYTSTGLNIMSDGGKVSFIWVFLPYTEKSTYRYFPKHMF
ncbi:MAG: hypothetical protein GXO79_15070 [Chlorobi bacterium]|nr:hypothetical protein [Chlorobiota bacterium]